MIGLEYNDPPSFGELLKQYRRGQKFTMRDVQARTDNTVSNQYIAYLENGTRPAPSVDVAFRLARALDLDAERAHLLVGLAYYESVQTLSANYLALKALLPRLDVLAVLPPAATVLEANLLIGPIGGRTIPAKQKLELVDDYDERWLICVIAE